MSRGSPRVLGADPGNGVSEVQVQLALRLIVHLSGVSPPGDDGLGRPDSTQQGIADALGVTQGAVSKVLRRLRAVEVLRTERRHVPGRTYRVRVYLLTRRGELLAGEIRARLASSPITPTEGSSPLYAAGASAPIRLDDSVG